MTLDAPIRLALGSGQLLSPKVMRFGKSASHINSRQSPQQPLNGTASQLTVTPGGQILVLVAVGLDSQGQNKIGQKTYSASYLSNFKILILVKIINFKNKNIFKFIFLKNLKIN